MSDKSFYANVPKTDSGDAGAALVLEFYNRFLVPNKDTINKWVGDNTRNLYLYAGRVLDYIIGAEGLSGEFKEYIKAVTTAMHGNLYDPLDLFRAQHLFWDSITEHYLVKWFKEIETNPKLDQS